MDRAACRSRGVDPTIFFPITPSQEAAARKVCRTCIVKDACLTHALQSGEADGIYGGMNPAERRKLSRPPRICRGCGNEMNVSPAMRYCTPECWKESRNRRHREQRRVQR